MEARKFRESTVRGMMGACEEPAEMEKCVRKSQEWTVVEDNKSHL